MIIRSLVSMAILLATGLSLAMRDGSPALALAAFTVVLTAWALVSFLQWREALRPRPVVERRRPRASPSSDDPAQLIERKRLDVRGNPLGGRAQRGHTLQVRAGL